MTKRLIILCRVNAKTESSSLAALLGHWEKLLHVVGMITQNLLFRLIINTV
ncbi:MAG: hypothetical protein LBC02_08265 [Planctomycetaceae bacterium]|nr:hypothetical protein [Planctomycetaceae bacterium]